MRNRLAALILLAIAIAVLAFLFSRHGDTAQSSVVPLTTLAPATVTRLVATRRGQPVFVLQRRAETWDMLAPKRAPADTKHVQSLLAALDEPTARDYPASSIELSTAGLEPPAWTLVANGVRLDFGTLNPATLLRYVRRGDTVYLVMDRIAPLLAAGPSAFLALPPASASHAGTAGS